MYGIIQYVSYDTFLYNKLKQVITQVIVYQDAWNVKWKHLQT
jgi:hypothetical protein